MARAPDEQMNKAKELYLSGMKLVEIASQLNKPEGTIRRWKNTQNWDNERSEGKANAQSERSDKKANVFSERSLKRSLPKEAPKREPPKEEFPDEEEGAELTEKQRLFCALYVKSFNATKAYQKAYDCSYETAAANGSRMLRNAKVRSYIVLLKSNRMNRELLSEEDIFQKYMDIAFADITDYLEFGRETVPVMGAFGPIQVEDKKTGEKVQLTEEVNTVRFKESAVVDGTLISEVSNGRNGATIKLADRMKALNWLSSHMDLATEEQKARLAIMRRKAAGGDTEAELEKLDQVLAEIKGVI